MKRLPRRVCLLGGLLRTLYYRRVHIIGTPCRDRPTLYLLSHRNGAIDGIVYQKALGDTPSLISIQLLRGPLRLLFDGIPVVRDKDRARYRIKADAVAAPVAAAIAQLRAGGSLALYPEGTSAWEPHPLPYHSGMAVIAAKLLAAGVDFVVQPAAAYYSKPDGFRSRVSLIFGAPFVPQGESVAALQKELAAALDAVSVNCADAAQFNQIQRTAWQAAQRGEDYGVAFIKAQTVANIGCASAHRTLPTERPPHELPVTPPQPCPVEGGSAPVAKSPTIAKPPADLSPPPVGEGQGGGSKPPAPATPQTATFTYTMSAQAYVNRFATSKTLPPAPPRALLITATPATVGDAANNLPPPPVGEGGGGVRLHTADAQTPTNNENSGRPSLSARTPFTYTTSAQAYVNRFAPLALALTCPLIVAAACLAGRAADGRNNASFFRILGGLAGALLQIPLWFAALYTAPTAGLLWLAAAVLAWRTYPEPAPVPLPETP